MYAENLTDLDLYREAFAFQQAVFALSKSFPREERYSLTDQIRRSSRSIAANLAEGWRKRRYPAHFVSKLSDADAELEETRHWLRTAAACGYLDSEPTSILEKAATVGRLLGAMLRTPDVWCRPR